MAASYHTSLLTATDCRSHIHLIIGSNSLAGKRCEQSLATGAKPILVAPENIETQPAHYGITKLTDSGQVTWLRQPFTDDLLSSLGREEVGGVVDAVFVTSANSSSLGATGVSAQHISALCKRNRIPINVVDRPDLCSFTILSTHTDGPLQVGITTNGRGCHLASRIRREVAASLPPALGTACLKLGEMRSRIQEEDQLLHHALSASGGGLDEEGLEQTASFNKLVTEEDLDAMKSRRMRWLAQVCEYWPLKRLAAISDEDMETVLKSYPGGSANIEVGPLDGGGVGFVPTSSRRGRIILAGSGPGHPDLLTRATHKAIQAADLILADKLVPSGVLDLIPRRTPVSIARKFPGNADQAQEEFLVQALAGVREGKTVLRLKQGDPFIYGRGGEEVEYFRRHGLGDRVTVLPGITSSLSAPLFAAIPPTQRDVADQVLICTGTGKKGKPPTPPEFVGSRTCVFLMALHRIGGLRASCPDQRVIRTTLEFVAEAIEAEGSRPPGLLVVGRACEVLYAPPSSGSGSGSTWTVEEGFKGLEVDVVGEGIAAGLAGVVVAA
ncbi:hypothetical protein VMCG_08496 [Cytospora schulzeri]|uniref:precorrin-2 dehydrogenase n=1 Tax=Cytospora schulzeri TaxID=448051 RepID=A0A423VWQ8_9PEZI|nr:hypothetical protein VMCG_08496 [Valsa malicola]